MCFIIKILPGWYFYPALKMLHTPAITYNRILFVFYSRMTTSSVFAASAMFFPSHCPRWPPSRRNQRAGVHDNIWQTAAPSWLLSLSVRLHFYMSWHRRCSYRPTSMSVDRCPTSLAHADVARRVPRDVFEYGDTAGLVSWPFLSLYIS